MLAPPVPAWSWMTTEPPGAMSTMAVDLPWPTIIVSTFSTLLAPPRVSVLVTLLLPACVEWPISRVPAVTVFVPVSDRMRVPQAAALCRVSIPSSSVPALMATEAAADASSVPCASPLPESRRPMLIVCEPVPRLTAPSRMLTVPSVAS